MSCFSSNFLLIIITSITMAAIPTLLNRKNQTMAHIHLYMHDQLSGPNATAMKVVTGSKPSPSRLSFGNIVIYDDPLTEGPTPDSAPIGRGRAFYPVAAFDKPVLLIVMNVVLTTGEYNGSSISIMGSDYIFAPVRELTVIGGTGQFRMARGYVIWKTFSHNLTSGDAVLELDIYATKANAC